MFAGQGAIVWDRRHDSEWGPKSIPVSGCRRLASRGVCRARLRSNAWRSRTVPLGAPNTFGSALIVQLALKNQAPPAIHRTSGCFLTIQVAPMSAISGKRFVSNASVRRPLWNIGTKTSLLWSHRGSCGLREQDSGTSLSPCRGQLSRKA